MEERPLEARRLGTERPEAPLGSHGHDESLWKDSSTNTLRSSTNLGRIVDKKGKK